MEVGVRRGRAIFQPQTRQTPPEAPPSPGPSAQHPSPLQFGSHAEDRRGGLILRHSSKLKKKMLLSQYVIVL